MIKTLNVLRRKGRAWKRSAEYPILLPHFSMDEQGLVHTKESSMAKLFAGDTAMWVADKAVQILGGYGYTTDFPAERFFQKSLLKILDI